MGVGSGDGVVLMFPGQGAQHPRMGAGLYGVLEPFTTTMDQAFTEFGPMGRGLRAEWLALTPSGMFDDISRAQPLLYAVNYAIARQLLAEGVRPRVVLGHSVGELCAATVAGVFDFPTGLGILRDFVRIYGRAPRGGMLAVAAGVDDLSPYLGPGSGVAVAAVNARRQTVLSAPTAALSAVRQRLITAGFVCVAMPAHQPFHHPVMATVVNSDDRVLTEPPLRDPHTTIYSAYEVGPVPADLARDWRFWLDQPARPVCFGPTLARLLLVGRWTLVESGPGQGLTGLARRTPEVVSGRSAVVPTLPARPAVPGSDLRTFQRALDTLRTRSTPRALTKR